MNSSDPTQVYAESDHPSVEQLNAFAVGQLTDDDSLEIERHLAVCVSCNRLLETSPDDSFVTLVQQSGLVVQSGSSPAVAPSRSLRLVPGYTLLEQLGEGGMGVVWKARQDGLERLVALKRLRSAGADSSEAMARFRREAESIARLHHANIVQVYEVGEQADELYLALEYVGGGSLAQKLAAGPLPPSSAAALVETLARAMHHAHEQGILHRDLKPGNVLLDETGAAKISDFGLAKQLNEATAHTQTGAILGTPSYMAPEQAGGGQSAIGPAADVYGLGAILYETLTGRPPFRGPTALDTLAQVREREPVPPRQLQPGVPRDLQTICLKCLHKEPRRRYKSALELAEDLRRFAAGEPIRARPVGRWERLLKWMRRNPYRAVLAVFLILVSLASVAALLWHDKRLHKEKDRAQAAERNAQDSYAKARQTLLSILDRYDNWYTSKDKIIGRMSEGMIEDTLTYIESVLGKGNENDPQVREDAARLLSRIGRIQGYHGKFEKARESFGRALTLWEQLSREQPEVSSYRLELAHCYRSLVYLGGAKGQRIEWLEKAVQIFEELCCREPKDDLHLPAGLAQCYNDLACLFINRQRLDEAETHLQKAVALFRSEIDHYPDRSRCKHGLADCYINLALIYVATRRPERAEIAYRRADSLLERLMSDVPDDLGVFISRSSMALNWGNLYLEMGQTDNALASYDRGISWCEAVLEKDADFSSARDRTWKLHGAKAQAYASLKRYAEAATEWKRALEWAEGPMRMQMRMWRSISLARGGDTAQAAAEADNVAADPTCSPDTLYNCACALALCGRSEQAVALLSKLRSNGYFKDADHLKSLRTDTDFDSLRHREDFLRLLKNVTAIPQRQQGHPLPAQRAGNKRQGLLQSARLVETAKKAESLSRQALPRMLGANDMPVAPGRPLGNPQIMSACI